MLFLVPFRSGNVPFAIVFGATKRCVTTELSHLGQVKDVVFLHITQMDLPQLASVMRNNLSDVGLGPENGFVQPTARGPRPAWFPIDNRGNYLLTVSDAVATLLRFTSQEQRVFWINMTATLQNLDYYVRGRMQNYIDSVDFQPAHWGPTSQTYIEFTMLLGAAANLKQTESRFTQVALQDEDEYSSPIFCFEQAGQLAQWLEGWMDDEGCGETSSSSTEALGPTTPLDLSLSNAHIEGRDLASRRREFGEQCVAHSFCNACDDRGEA